MKIYLDTCVFNRPFDDQSVERNFIESEAFLVILKKIETREYKLAISLVNIIENAYNPFFERKQKILSLFSLANEVIKVEIEDVKRAEYLESLGFKGLDALHIAVCEKAGIDYFITCDDKLLKKYEKHKNKIKIKIISILQFLEREVFK